MPGEISNSESFIPLTPEQEKKDKELRLTAELHAVGFKDEYITNLVNILSAYKSVVVLSSQETNFEVIASQAVQMQASQPDSKIVFNFEGEAYLLGVRDYAHTKDQLMDRHTSLKSTEENRTKTFTELFGDTDVGGITEAYADGPYGEAEILRNTEAKIKERFPNTYDVFSKMTWGEFTHKLKDSCQTEKDQQDAVKLIEEYEKRHQVKVEKLNKKEQYAQQVSLDLPIEQRPLSEFFGFYFHEKKHKARDLYQVISFLQGRPVDADSFNEDAEKALKGKKILILGDDTGSFSEILNSFGAEAIGIEYDKKKVLTAHSGVFSESNLPQDQVIYGDIGDLTDQSSDLYKTLLEKGPFDVITSSAVFNIGSGIDNAIEKRGIGKEFANKEENFGRALVDSSMNLLTENGFSLHDSVDMRRMFGRYGHRNITKFVGSMRSLSYSEINKPFFYGEQGTGHDGSLIFIPKSSFEEL